jgi:hypothetical protein
MVILIISAFTVHTISYGYYPHQLSVLLLTISIVPLFYPSNDSFTDTDIRNTLSVDLALVGCHIALLLHFISTQEE